MTRTTFLSSFFSRLRRRYGTERDREGLLDVPERINYKLNVTVHHCSQGKSSEIPGRLLHTCFRSRRPSTTTLSQSTTPYCATASPAEHFRTPRAFSVAGPTSCHSLPDRLRDPTLSSGSFRANYLKHGTICELLNALCAVEMLHDSVVYKFTIDIDM